ncbi:MAG: hypothetical protein J7L45_03520 [Candidatus Aenigmarchaeota archaeon]|nr:hypothetical protein [Candidatus Aenigmarchaeota archaeon]
MKEIYKCYIKDLEDECYEELKKIFGRVPKTHKKLVKKVMKGIKDWDIEVVDTYLNLKNLIKTAKGVEFKPYLMERLVNYIFDHYELKMQLESEKN